MHGKWGECMLYVYVDHLGGSFYGSETEYDDDMLYCESCGDCDYLYGVYESWDDFINQYTQSILIDASRGLNEICASKMLLEYDGERLKIIEEVADE